MKDKIVKHTVISNPEKMREKTALLCTLFLLAARVFYVPFYAQLFALSVLIFLTFKVWKSGFDSLVALSPTVDSLAAVSAFFALLHGLFVLSHKNYFFYAAVLLACLYLGKADEEKKVRTFLDKACAAVMSLSPILIVISITVSVVGKKNFFETLNNINLVFVFICPCAMALSSGFFEGFAQRECLKHKIILQTPSAFERIGKTKEIIIGQEKIVTEKEYSLYDIYSTDGDKLKLLEIASALEINFEHPYSTAVVKAAKSEECVQRTAENCFEICSKGICGTIDGDKYLLGNKRLLKDKKICVPEVVAKTDFGVCMPLYMAKNGEFYGIMLLYSQMTYGAAEALDYIGALGIRRILIADGERADLKKHFDILLFEKEKVLQEFKKGVKIKAMTVTEKKIADSDVSVLLSGGGVADAYLGTCPLPDLLFLLLICRKIYARYKMLICTSVAVSQAFCFMAAFGIAVSPLWAAIVSFVPLAFGIGLKVRDLPQIIALEEEHMFGKINYTVKIEGMSCTHCSARVKTALESLRGVSADVSLEEKTARVKCPSSTKAETLEKAVSDVGFTVVSVERV